MADEMKAEDGADEELDQIIQDMSKEDEEVTPAAAPASKAKAPLAVVSKEASAAPAASTEQSLRLELTGVINLKLSFSSGGRSIELTCTEEALLCRMADGTEFRLPTGTVASKRKAA